MNIEKVNKLKLLENEVVYCESFELACKCCELAHKLGLTWNSGVLYIHQIFFEEKPGQIVYDFHEGIFATHSFICKKSISAIEWLNRHGVFVYGQKVLCADHLGSPKEERRSRTYIESNIAVAEVDNEMFDEKKPFTTCAWKYMYSPFSEWKDKLDTIITFADGTKVGLSKEAYEELKKRCQVK